MEDEDDYLPPWNTNTLSVPNDPALIAVYELYRSPLDANRKLLSERKRETFAEALNGPDRVPTLADLCVRQLAKRGTAHMAAEVREDPLKLRIYYDALDVELPLRECYFVEDLSFWRRVVLAKCTDKCLAMRGLNEYDWRGKGLSMKYVELVEACPAALWPEKEMTELALTIRDHVRSMDIRHLQSQTEYAFRKAGLDASDSEPEITSEESQGMDISSDEPNTPVEEEGEEEEEDEEDVGITWIQPKSAPSKKVTAGIAFVDDDDPDTERREARRNRNAARQRLRDMKEAQQAEHEARRQRRLLMRKPPPEPPRRKRARKQKIKGVFDIHVEPEPPDGDELVMDHRNKERYLNYLKKFDYPEDDCWHIDLGFVRHFENLVSLTLEFLGPPLGREYHKRHLRFSIKDMVHLSRGLAFLEQLQIFRLRNSRLNAFKLYPLCRVLRSLPSLEVVDFGYDQMPDDCGPHLGILLDRRCMLKSLELEYNRLDVRAMSAIGQALQRSSPTKLHYLGLAHNKIGCEALGILCTHLKGTEHVLQLNLSGIEVNARCFTDEISDLLRRHEPLRQLKMVAIPLGPDLGRRLMCALNTSTNITLFDCRDCDLDVESELQADLVVRRNIYRAENSYVVDTSRFPETDDLLEFAKTLKHPIVEQIESDMARREECYRNYPARTSSVPTEAPPELPEPQMSEYDIWEVLGITQHKVTKPPPPEESARSSKFAVPFTYDPNSFDLEQFREHVSQPGPGNRYAYLRERRGTII